MEWTGHLFKNHTGHSQTPTLSTPHLPSSPLQVHPLLSQTPPTMSRPQPTNPENGDVDLSDLHDHMPCGYLCCWLLFLPFAVCAGFVLSPRHKGARKDANGEEVNAETQGRSIEREKGTMSRLERLAQEKRARVGARIDLMPRVEENSGGGGGE